MKNLLSLFCLLATLICSAQSTAQKRKPLFYSANQAGLLEGVAGTAFLVQTVNGLQYKGWAAGLGVGIDKYKERSVPVFVQIRRVIIQKKLPLFLYADAGINIPWPLPADNQWPDRKSKTGLYLDGGVQYQWKIAQRQALLISAGYSEKKYSMHFSIPSFCIDGTCPDHKNSWYYTYRRIAIKAGWKF